ncbi:MAG: hypothetical protein ACRDRR_24605 [Pseudonocardiaceae bacterium]
MPVPYDRWRDADGTHIPEECRVEQIAVAKEHGALPSHLRKQGWVTGRGNVRLTVLFDGEDKPSGVRPHLVRVVTTPDAR